MSTSASPPSPTPTYPSLPREIRLHILRQTHLVRLLDWVWNSRASGAGPTILNGRLLAPRNNPRNEMCRHGMPAMGDRHCEACPAGYFIPFPSALFTVSKQMYEDAQEVFWSQRFVLHGDSEKSKRWLDGLRDSQVQRIRKLDLVLDWQQEGWWGDGDVTWVENEEGWKGLIHVISRRLCLERLHLSVDAGMESIGLVMLVKDEVPLDPDLWLKRVYKRTLGPIVRELKGRLEMFHVFLCWAVAAEGLAEKLVLGGKWEILREGKVEYYDRDQRNPHWKILEEERETRSRAITGFENLRMFNTDEEEILRWLQEP